MLSKFEYSEIQKIVGWSCNFGLLPADWNSEEQRISYPTHAKWKKYQTPGLLIYHIMYTVFIVCRLSMELKMGKGPERLLLHALFTCSNSFLALFHCHVLKSPGNICNLFNALASFDENQGPEGMDFTHSCTRQLLISLFTRADWIILVAIGSTSFLKPNNSNFVYSVYPCQTTGAYIFFGLIENFFLIHIYLAANFIFLYVTYYVLSTRFWILRVCQRVNASPQEKTSLKYYRILLILNDMYNGSWANLLIPGFKLILFIVVICALYGTIRFAGAVEITIFLWCPMMAIFLGGIFVLLPPLFASVYVRSIGIVGKRDAKDGKREKCFLFLSSVSNGKYRLPLEHRILNREWLACRPMVCKSGWLYVFERNTGLTCVNIIVQMTAYFLVIG